jgi:FdhE protein
VAKTAWQQRIRRAEVLATQHSFAVEVLSFYVHIARFQEGLHQQMESFAATSRSERDERSAGTSAALRVSSPTVSSASGSLPDRQDEGATIPIASFPPFLAVVEEHGPERLSQVASKLRSQPATACSELINAVWSDQGEALSNPEGFLALAFLQPYAEFVRSQSHLQLEGYTHPLCPFCNRKPALGVLRPLGDGAQRRLMCDFCLAEWEFRRIVCPGCGQEDHAKLPVYTAETFPHIRVECCDACKTYIKSIDLAKNGLADPLVDELASLPLDLWAQEHEYAKLHPNMFGM